jgi:general secretion pathway protein G
MKVITKRGFTLIELLVAISIIGLLSSVVLITLNDARERAKRTKFVQELKQVQTALEVYKSDNGHYPYENWTDQVDEDRNTLSLCMIMVVVRIHSLTT